MNDAPKTAENGGPVIVIDPMLCDGHALCVAVAPTVFEMGDDERARVVDGVVLTDALAPAVAEAVRVCPCQAIEVRQAG